jgi:hypothetical protein
MTTPHLSALLGACAIAGLGLIGGCATPVSSAASIASGAASIEAARSAGAPELDAVGLNEARNKLEKARALANAGDDRGAMRMAEQADADAQLARAKAGSERSRLAVTELENGLQTLRDELNRAAAKQAPRPMP